MSFLESLEQIGFVTWIHESPSPLAYPTILLLHVMGMAIVVGISFVISLRLLGFAPKAPVQPLQRLYPLLWWSFGVNAITGSALVLANATTRLVQPAFYVKMLFVFAGLAVVQRTRRTVLRHIGPDNSLPDGAKGLAWAGLVCWSGAVTIGRLLAYL